MPKIFLIRQELELQHQQLSGSIKNQDQQVFSWDILGERKAKSCDEKYPEQPEDWSSTKCQQREDGEPTLGESRVAWPQSEPCSARAVSQSDCQQTCLVSLSSLTSETFHWETI